MDKRTTTREGQVQDIDEEEEDSESNSGLKKDGEMEGDTEDGDLINESGNNNMRVVS
jgi:hypothetical protein